MQPRHMPLVTQPMQPRAAQKNRRLPRKRSGSASPCPPNEQRVSISLLAPREAFELQEGLLQGTAGGRHGVTPPVPTVPSKRGEENAAADVKNR